MRLRELHRRTHVQRTHGHTCIRKAHTDWPQPQDAFETKIYLSDKQNFNRSFARSASRFYSCPLIRDEDVTRIHVHAIIGRHNAAVVYVRVCTCVYVESSFDVALGTHTNTRTHRRSRRPRRIASSSASRGLFSSHFSCSRSPSLVRDSLSIADPLVHAHAKEKETARK